MDEQGPSEHQQASQAQPAARAPSNRNHGRLSLAPLTSLDAANASSSSSRARSLPQGKSAPNTPGHHNHNSLHRTNTSTTSAPVSRATSSAHLHGTTTSHSSSSSIYGSHYSNNTARRHRPRPRYAPPEPTFLDKCQAIGHALGGFVREERGQTSTWTRRDQEEGRLRRSRSSFLTPFEELYGGGGGGGGEYGGDGDGVWQGGEESADPAYREYARLKREAVEMRDGVYSPGYNGLHNGGGSVSSRMQSRRGSAAFLAGGGGGGSVPLTPRTPREDYFGNGAHQAARTPRRSGVEGMMGMGRATVPEEADFVDLELLREREEAEEREADAEASLRRYISERRSGAWPWFLSWFGLPLYEPLDVEQELEYKAWDAEGAAEAEELEREAADRCRQRRARVLEDEEFTFDPPQEQGNMWVDYAWLSSLAVSLLRE